MRALVYLGPGQIRLEQRPEPRLREATDVLVRITGTGICGTDRKILLGHFPARRGVILGHEAIGLVHAVGVGVRSLTEGDRVVIDPTLYCGLCPSCRRGATNFCVNKAGAEVGIDRNGTFTQFTVLPERFVHRLPDTLAFRSAILIEPLACVLNNMLAASLSVADTVAILGAGPIGTMSAMVAERQARRTVTIEADPGRRQIAAAMLGNVIGPRESVEDACGGRPSLIVETTGRGLETAIGLIADGGRIVLMGFDGTYTAAVPTLHLTNHGIKLIGAGDYRADTFPMALDLASELRLDGVVTHEFPLEEYADAFGMLGDVAAPVPTGTYRAMKVVIRSDL